ncbi:DUF2199 domain-containing protein [Pseudomonas alcaligenes]|uniref:DUF2199 domain-containing protein n=1 Tax=Aquipseudomonas alcaligenes TaxID=43263 RepID=UPI00358FA4D3
MLICECCGKDHPLEELELTFRRPDDVVSLSKKEREESVHENDDLCVISDARFFIRALLPLPVKGRDLPYNIGIWVEADQSTFERVYDLWSDPEQGNESSFIVKIANNIPTLSSTVDLVGYLQLTGPTTRPTIQVKQQQHQLYDEQSNGITAHRAHEYSSLFG